MVFMSCNLIGGMMQRLDKLRKNAFSSVCLFGENNNSTISGIWVWRGHDLVFELSDDWKIDYSSYNWTKLDTDSEETKSLVDQYFKWEGTDKEGRKFNQGKIFKKPRASWINISNGKVPTKKEESLIKEKYLRNQEPRGSIFQMGRYRQRRKKV